MKKMRSMVTGFIRTLAAVGDNVSGANYTTYHTK